jgi:hypothetical protein
MAKDKRHKPAAENSALEFVLKGRGFSRAVSPAKIAGGFSRRGATEREA